MATRETSAAAAQHIGRRLAASALRGRDDATWIGLSGVPLGADLSDGLPGVILFLAYLGRLTRDEDALRLARAGETCLRRQITDGVEPLSDIGAFSGWGGLIYAFAHLSQVLDDSSLLDEAHAIVEQRLPALIAGDQQLDIMGGAAGCIGALLALHAVSPRDSTLATAVACGERLLNTAVVMPSGIAWRSPAGNGQALTGFAHGAAGFAWALERLSKESGRRCFAKAAEAALLYERSQVSPKAGDWRGERSGTDSQRSMVASCYGSTAIGLPRLASLNYADDTLDEINAAVESTQRAPRAVSDVLCPGELARLELLLCALSSPLGTEAPGLMNGLAGIGYGLLRLAEPTRVPPVLMLEPPFGDW